MNYDSRRITISYLAVIELCKMFDLPQDAPTQALGAGVEKLIFQNGSLAVSQPQPEPNQPTQPNKQALTAMVAGFKGAA